MSVALQASQRTCSSLVTGPNGSRTRDPNATLSPFEDGGVRVVVRRGEGEGGTAELRETAGCLPCGPYGGRTLAQATLHLYLAAEGCLGTRHIHLALFSGCPCKKDCFIESATCTFYERKGQPFARGRGCHL